MFIRSHFKPSGKRNSLCTPLPFGNLSLLDPRTPRKFHDPPWGGEGVWIFSGTTQFVKVYFLRPISKQEAQTFAIACLLIVNKLHDAIDSSISPISTCLINKVHSIYISIPWFRFTLMDLALRILFHRFQILFARIRLNVSIATGTKSTNAIKYSCFHG